MSAAPNIELPAPDSPAYGLLKRASEDKDVKSLVLKAAEGLSDEEVAWFASQPIGSKGREAFAAIEAFYGMAGRPILKFDYADFWYYYYPTARLNRYARRFDLTCTEGTRLHGRLASSPALLTQLRVKCTIDSCRFDGVVIDYESARQLLLLDMKPRTVPEQVVRNAFDLFGDMDAYSSRPWTVDMAVEVFERLSDGVRTRDRGWLDSTAVAEHSSQLYPYPTPRAILQAICDIANGKGVREGSHPLYVSSIIERMLSIYRPFPEYGGVAGIFLWHCYAAREGFPVLQHAPYSTILHGEPDHHSKVSAPEKPRPDWNGWTPMPDFTTGLSRDLGLLDQALDMLVAQVESFEARRDGLSAIAEIDPRLNGRQLGIVGKCLREPATAFRVSYHRTWNAIGNTAARQDFLDLEAAGYLTSAREGHAIVYRATPLVEERFGADLAEQLRDLWAATAGHLA